MIRRVADGYVLETEQSFGRPPEEVFLFFADAENLARITPPWLDFSILTPLPIEMRQGAMIDYRLKLHRIPLRWRTEITAWEPPHRFVDSQVQGPYRCWVHEHVLEPRNRGTLMRDRITFRSRGPSLIIPLLHCLFVNRSVMKVFAYRRTGLQAMLPTSST
jgi:ligand-binding SRPBCC domain-containing protein